MTRQRQEKNRIAFEQVKRVEDVRLPERSTKGSAGYDFFAIEDVVIPPFHKQTKPTLIPTGVKVKMPNRLFLMLANRSSNPLKRNLVIPQSVGIIDADFYNNEDNEGEVAFCFYNVGQDDIVIKKGDKLGQGIFLKYFKTDVDRAEGVRTGGYGSTGE